MYTPFKVFAQDTRDPIQLQINQDLTGLSAVIRTKNLDTDAVVEAAAAIVGAPADGVLERPWQDGERAESGGLYFIEAVVSWPGPPVTTRTYPGAGPPAKSIIVQVLPRRTTPATP